MSDRKELANHVNTDVELASLPTIRIREMLAEAFQQTIEGIQRTAVLIAELDRRNEDIGCAIPMLQYLRSIAAGQLLAAIVFRFLDHPQVLRVAMRIPIEDQQKLADGGLVPLAVKQETGGWTHRMVDPATLRFDELSQVFGDTGIRPESAQIAYRESLVVKSKTVKLISKGDNFKIGGKTFPKGEVVKAITDNCDNDNTDDPKTAVVTCKLTDKEHIALKRRAADAKSSVPDMVRRALKLSQLI